MTATVRDWKYFLADLARPYSIYSTSTGATAATVVLAWRAEDLATAGIFIGAVYAGLAGLYGFKAWENTKTTSQVADVEKTRITEDKQ